MNFSCGNNSNNNNSNGNVLSASEQLAQARRCRMAALINLLLALFATTVGIIIGAIFASAFLPFLPILVIFGLIALILLIAAIVLSCCGTQ